MALTHVDSWLRQEQQVEALNVSAVNCRTASKQSFLTRVSVKLLIIIMTPLLKA